MSPVRRPDSAGVNGQELQQILRSAANNPDLSQVDWAALHRSIMMQLRAESPDSNDADANDAGSLPAQ